MANGKGTMQMKATTEKRSTVELATFYIGEALCGMDILNVQEIRYNIQKKHKHNSTAISTKYLGK